jgi:hypothetical protein
MMRLPKVQHTDNPPATFLGHHLLPSVLVTKEGAPEVYIEDAIEVISCS